MGAPFGQMQAGLADTRATPRPDADSRTIWGQARQNPKWELAPDGLQISGGRTTQHACTPARPL